MNALTILLLLIALAALSLPPMTPKVSRLDSTYSQTVGATQHEQAQ